MKNLGIKFKIAINSMFIFALTFNAVELFVKFIMLDIGKIKSIDYQVGWSDAVWFFGLFIVLISYCAEDLIESIKSLKDGASYGIPKFNVKTPMPEVKTPKQQFDGTNGNGYQPVKPESPKQPPKGE